MKLKKQHHLLILAAITILCAPHTVCATEREETSQQKTVIASDHAYLYKDLSRETILGEIPAGSRITVSNDEGNMYRVSFADTEGFIQKESIQTDLDHTNVQIHSEFLLPATHYYQYYDATAGMALVNYTMDIDSGNDYIILCNGEDINIPGYFIRSAYENGCGELQIYYTSNQMDKDLCIAFSPWNAKDTDILNISFTYANDTLSFTSDTFLCEIKVGFPEKLESVFILNGTASDTKTQNGYDWVTLHSPGEVKLSRPANSNVMHEQTTSEPPNTKKTHYIIISVLLILFIIIVGVFEKKRGY